MMMSMQRAADYEYLIKLPIYELLDMYGDFRELREEMKGGGPP